MARDHRRPSSSARRRLAASLAVCLAVTAAVLASQSPASHSVLASAGAGQVLRCTAPDDALLRTFHGGKLTLVVTDSRAAAVAAVDLAAGQPEETADFRLTRLTATSWSFESLRVDPPSRTVRHRVLLQASLKDGSRETVTCDVFVVHRHVAFGATCAPNPLQIPHGQAGVLRIVRIPGSAPIVSTGLATGYPALTAKRSVTKLANNRFRFRSRVVDPPARVETYVVRVRVRFGTPANIVASIVKNCVVHVKHAPQQPNPQKQFQVQMTTTFDHDSPQSDICVTLTTSPAQPGARARVILHAPPQLPVGKDQAIGIALDGKGAGRTRFLVDVIGTYQIVAEVTGAGGVTSAGQTTINNAQPNGSCRA